jgi:hypothetical protein
MKTLVTKNDNRWYREYLQQSNSPKAKLRRPRDLFSVTPEACVIIIILVRWSSVFLPEAIIRS